MQGQSPGVSLGRCGGPHEGEKGFFSAALLLQGRTLARGALSSCAMWTRQSQRCIALCTCSCWAIHAMSMRNVMSSSAECTAGADLGAKGVVIMRHVDVAVTEMFRAVHMQLLGNACRLEKLLLAALVIETRAAGAHRIPPAALLMELPRYSKFHASWLGSACCLDRLLQAGSSSTAVLCDAYYGDCILTCSQISWPLLGAGKTCVPTRFLCQYSCHCLGYYLLPGPPTEATRLCSQAARTRSWGVCISACASCARRARSRSPTLAMWCQRPPD